MEQKDVPRATSPPNNHGPRPEKSYYVTVRRANVCTIKMKRTLDWNVNSVRPKKTPRVISLKGASRSRDR